MYACRLRQAQLTLLRDDRPELAYAGERVSAEIRMWACTHAMYRGQWVMTQRPRGRARVCVRACRERGEEQGARTEMRHAPNAVRNECVM